MMKWRELSQALRRLPIGVEFSIEVKPAKENDSHPNLIGTLVQTRLGSQFLEVEPDGGPSVTAARANPKKKTAVGRSVTK